MEGRTDALVQLRGGYESNQDESCMTMRRGGRQCRQRSAVPTSATRRTQQRVYVRCRPDHHLRAGGGTLAPSSCGALMCWTLHHAVGIRSANIYSQPNRSKPAQGQMPMPYKSHQRQWGRSGSCTSTNHFCLWNREASRRRTEDVPPALRVVTLLEL